MTFSVLILLQQHCKILFVSSKFKVFQCIYILFRQQHTHCDTIRNFLPIYMPESPQPWPVNTILSLWVVIVIAGPDYLLQPLQPDRHSRRQTSQSLGLGCLSCSRLPMSLVSHHLTSKVSQKTPKLMRHLQSILMFHVSCDFESILFFNVVFFFV